MAITFAPLTFGLQAELARGQKQRFPGIKPGDFLKAALDIQALSESGQQPRITTDPFTGNLVVSTEDQANVLEGILADRGIRDLLQPTPEETLAAQRVRQDVLAVIPGTIGATARLVAPGVVVRGEIKPGAPVVQGRPLSGPCAGGTSLSSQIGCNIGGFA